MFMIKIEFSGHQGNIHITQSHAVQLHKKLLPERLPLDDVIDPTWCIEPPRISQHDFFWYKCVSHASKTQ